MEKGNISVDTRHRSNVYQAFYSRWNVYWDSISQELGNELAEDPYAD